MRLPQVLTHLRDLKMDESLGVENWDILCLVCGKSVEHGGGMCHFKVEDQMVALCCPLCIETFQKNPKRYLSLRKMQRPQPP